MIYNGLYAQLNDIETTFAIFKEAIEMLKNKMDGSIDTSYSWCETIRLAIQALEKTDYLNSYYILSEHAVASQFKYEYKKYLKVNFRIINQYIAVEGVNAAYTLRYGNATACVFNETMRGIMNR